MKRIALMALAALAAACSDQGPARGKHEGSYALQSINAQPLPVQGEARIDSGRIVLQAGNRFLDILAFTVPGTGLPAIQDTLEGDYVLRGDSLKLHYVIGVTDATVIADGQFLLRWWGAELVYRR